MDIESTAQYLFHCIAYFTKSLTLLSIIGNIDNNLLDLCNPVLIKILLFGSNSFDANANTNVLNATIEYVLSTNKFEEEPFQWSQEIFKQGYESENSVSMVYLFIFYYVFFYYYSRVPLQLVIGTSWWLSL